MLTDQGQTFYDERWRQMTIESELDAAVKLLQESQALDLSRPSQKMARWRARRDLFLASVGLVEGFQVSRRMKAAPKSTLTINPTQLDRKQRNQ